MKSVDAMMKIHCFFILQLYLFERVLLEGGVLVKKKSRLQFHEVVLLPQDQPLHQGRRPQAALLLRLENQLPRLVFTDHVLII